MLCIAVIGVSKGEAQPVSESSLQEFHPQLLGAGGTHSGLRAGLPALFTNPALLTELPLTITYFSLTSWMHSNVVDFFPAFSQLLDGNVSSGSSVGIPHLLETGGMGVGSSVIGGIYGNNLALALSITSDFFFYGNAYPQEVFGTATQDARLLLSIALPIRGENVRFSAGFTIEPFYRISTFLPPDQALDFLQSTVNELTPGGVDYFNAENTLYGSGVSLHGGLLLVLFDEFSIQFTARDIGDTNISYSRTTTNNLLSRASRLSLPPRAQVGDQGDVGDGTWVLPFKARLGIAYHPRWDVGVLIEPTFSLEVSERILRAADTTNTTGNSPLTDILEVLHIGAQAKFNNRFIVQTGLSQGQLTLGTGFDFGVFELHSAWFGLVRDLPQKRVTSHGIIISLQFNNIIGDS